MGRHETGFNLQKEIEIVGHLKEHLRSIGVEDNAALLSAIESETLLSELMGALVDEEFEINADAKKLTEKINAYQDRKRRLEARKETIRSLLMMAMQQMETPTYRTPFGTISHKRNPISIEVFDQQVVEDEYWIIPPAPSPVVNMQALRAAALSRDEERQAERSAIHERFVGQIAMAEAISDPERRRVALEKIQKKIEPLLAKIDERLPEVPGVRVLEQSFCISIRR